MRMGHGFGAGLYKRLAALTLIFFLSGGVATAFPLFDLGPAGPKTVTLDPDDPATLTTHLTPAGLSTLKGVKRVAVSQFQVEYVLNTDGLTARERGQIRVDYAIAGLPDAALQSEADRLAEGFTAGLTAAGIEVVPFDQLAAAPSWARLASVAKPSGAELHTAAGAGRLFNAGTRPWYFYAGDPHLGNWGLSWAFTPGQSVEQAVSRELDVAVITVRLVVGVRETRTHDALLAIVRNGESFKGAPRLELAPGSAVLVAISGKTVGMSMPSGRGGYTVSDHLLFKDDVLGAVLTDKTSGLGKASNLASTAMFAGAIFANMNGGNINMKLDKAYRFEAAPAPAEYVGVVDRNLSAAMKVLLAQITAAF